MNEFMNGVSHSSENGSSKLRRSVYMDANATTQLLPDVYEAMVPYLLNESGNSSSNHRHGRHARAAIETARRQVAYPMNLKPHIAEIDKQISKLQHARAILLGLESTPERTKPGTPRGSGKSKRKLSADARAKISAAQKKRWAAAKKSA